LKEKNKKMMIAQTELEKNADEKIKKAQEDADKKVAAAEKNAAEQVKQANM